MKSSFHRRLPLGVAVAMAVAFVRVGVAGPGTRPAAGPAAYPTPDAAAVALADAARASDAHALLAVLGEDGRDVVDSGDPVADAGGRAWFAGAYDRKHSLQTTGDARATLLVGDGDWPLPLPLVRTTAGTWQFDAAAGRDEILNRRIGRNEIATMKTMLAVVDAQQEYARSDHAADAADAVADREGGHAGLPTYADRFASRPGKKDGLYWPTKPGEPDSPLGALFADAAEEGYGAPATRPTTAPAVGPRKPYHGYFYRILTGQGPAATGGAMDYRIDGRLVGGFAVVAWPADYGNSGVMTFLVNHQGVLYQRDLGENAKAAAEAVRRFDPTAEWAKADDGE